MGLFFSNLNNPPKPPHEVLGLPPLFTKSQARSQYLKLIRLNPTLISNYNSAYNILKNEPPNLNLYKNHNVLCNSVLILDLFDRISDFSGFKCPEFRSPDFYKKFKNFNCPRKFKREEERNLFNFKIRKIIKEVYKIYECGNVREGGGVGRIEGGSKVDIKDNIKVDIKDNNKEVDNPIIKLDKQFKCSYCSKGFRSKNQLINHLKSKKHFEKIKEKEKEPKRFIKKEIENLEGGSEGDEVEGGSKVREGEVEGGNVDNSEVKDIEVGVKGININNKMKINFINKDPIAFRTCSRCNKRFENRIKMIEHIKKDH